MWDAHGKRSSGYRTPRVQAGLLPRDYRAVWEASFTGSLGCRHFSVPGCQPGHQEEGDQSISLPSLLSSALLLWSDNLGYFSFTERIDVTIPFLPFVQIQHILSTHGYFITNNLHDAINNVQISKFSGFFNVILFVWYLKCLTWCASIPSSAPFTNHVSG